MKIFLTSFLFALFIPTSALALCQKAGLLLIEGQTVLLAKVEGRILRLLLDTGGNLSLNLEKNHIDSFSSLKKTTKAGRSIDASGKTYIKPIYILPQLSIAGINFNNVETSPNYKWGIGTHPLEGKVDGVVGLGMLKQHDFILDPAQQKILIGSDCKQNYVYTKEWIAQPLDYRKFGVKLAITLDSHRYDFVIDSAATHSFIRKAALPLLHKLLSSRDNLIVGKSKARLYKAAILLYPPYSLWIFPSPAK